MPTASEFATTARRLDELARWVGGPLTAVGLANQQVCVGGQLADLLGRTIEDAVDHVAVTVDACTAAAARARERAEACREYTGAMVEYRAALERVAGQLAIAPASSAPLDWPRPPVRPGPWADEG